MAKTRFNVAIVGLGFGAEFIPIYQRHPNAHMFGLCQRDEGKLRQLGDLFKVDRLYTRYEDLLKDPNIDAVHINTPVPNHASMSAAALEAGKHVMCTVPMATTIEDCRRLVELVKHSGLKYMMAE